MATTATPLSVGPLYAPEDPTLPKLWRGLVDGKTGYLYFWNPETNVTQYQRPVASPLPMKPPSPSAKPPSPVCTMSSSVRLQQSSRNDDTNGRVSDIGTRTDQSHNVPNNSRPSGASAKQGSSDGGSSLSAEAYRRHYEITVTGDKVPPPLTSFEATGFPSEILKEEMKF